jgi:hypothetical protein
MLLAGDNPILLDNCSEPLGGDLICSSLTEQLVRIRILGQSKSPLVYALAATFATGNNLTIFGDLSRRSLMSLLDPKCERPELRTFNTEDPVKVLQRDRARYVVAVLTALRAYVVAGKPKQAEPLGSFEEWSNLVRSALLWLGEADPCDTMEKIREEDPDIRVLSAILVHWARLFDNRRVTGKEIVESISERTEDHHGSYHLAHPEFYDTLFEIAGDGNAKSGTLNTRKLGHWLAAHKGRVCDGKRIIQAGDRQRAVLWQIETV